MNTVHKGADMPKIIEDPTSVILEEARKILFSEGYEGLNMRIIAKNCGIATGTIYNYFPKKDDLIAQMMMTHWNNYFLLIDKIDEETSDIYEKLNCIYMHFKIFTDEFHSVFLSRNFKTMYATDETRANKNDFMNRLQQRIEKILEHHFKESDLKISHAEVSTFVLANFIAVSYVPSYSYALFASILQNLYER